MTGDHKVSAICIRTYQRRNQNTILLNTFHHFPHILIHNDLEGMTGEIDDLLRGDRNHLFAQSIFPLCLGGKQVIY